jgi:ferric iron reductase protein FhuF
VAESTDQTRAAGATTPDSAADLITRLAPLDLRSRLDPPAIAQAEGRPLAPVGPLLARLEAGLFPAPGSPLAAQVGLGPSCPVARRRLVAASVGFQAVVGQVATPVILAEQLFEQGLDVRLDDVRWRVDGWTIRYGLAEVRPGPVRPLSDALVDLVGGVVAPWIDTVTAHLAIGRRLLWGNAVAALVGAVRSLDRLAPLGPAASHAAVAAIEGAVPPHGLMEHDQRVGPLDGSRTTCCLIPWAGLAPCDDCGRPVTVDAG